jgi:hypothetical protein
MQMKTIIFLIGMLSAIFVSGQSGWRQVIVDDTQRYPVRDEGGQYKTTSRGPQEIIAADLIINGDSTKKIMSTTAMAKGDTINILIYQTTPAYHHEYSIVLLKGKYKAEYYFLTSGEEVDRKLKTLRTGLKLNSTNYKKGDIIRGSIEYSGECLKGCWGKKDYNIRGNFVVKIE